MIYLTVGHLKEAVRYLNQMDEDFGRVTDDDYVVCLFNGDECSEPIAQEQYKGAVVLAMCAEDGPHGMDAVGQVLGKSVQVLGKSIDPKDFEGA